MADSDISVTVDGIESLRANIGLLLKPGFRKRMMREIGHNVQEHTADWLAQASVTRHKTADALGARHSGFLEFAPGRVRSVARFKGENGKPPTIRSDNETEDSVDIVFDNTPGLRRAFGPMTIVPVRAKALTIPKDKVSYGRRVSELKSEGHDIYRPRGLNILVEDIKGKGKKKTKGGKNWRILYALCKRVTIKHDPELLPDANSMSEWAAETAETMIDMEMG